MRITILLISLFLSFSSTSFSKDSTEWLLIYYVPYDNNLSEYSDSILLQFQNANLEKVSVLMLIDRADSSGMVRYKITKEGTSTTNIKSERITHKKHLIQLFRYASKEFNAKCTALFMLNHGGRLNEIGQDLYPDSTFLKLTDLRKSMYRYSYRSGSDIDLLFMQVCAKSSIGALYEVSSGANYTLASQKLLGAPNYYYQKMIDSLNHNPDRDGKELAGIIAKSDRKDMFESLTCIDNDKFYKIRREFLKFISVLEVEKTLKFHNSPNSFNYAGEMYWDLIDFLNQLNLTKEDAKAQRDALIAAITNELIVFVQYSDQSKKGSYSGISILALQKDVIFPYWWKMKFFEDFRINKIAKD